MKTLTSPGEERYECGNITKEIEDESAQILDIDDFVQEMAKKSSIKQRASKEKHLRI